MSDSSGFRSRFAGMPGSLVAIRVDYSRTGTAFDAPGSDTAVGRVRSEVRRWKQGHRLGDKPEWNGQTHDEKEMAFPSRPIMHALSEFQAVKLQYNYRASELPDVNKSSMFVRRPNKMQVDSTLFLSGEERSRLVPRCPGTATLLSSFEHRNTTLPGVDRESGWNVSTLPADDRTSIFKNKTYEDFLAVNAARRTRKLEESYVSPMERQEAIAVAVRAAKMEQRSAAKRREGRSERRRGDAAEAGGSARVFKMSNIDSWWGNNPVLGGTQPAAAGSGSGGTTTLPPLDGRGGAASESGADGAYGVM